MKKNMFYIILVGLISILGLSYSIFITDSRKVTTSELLVSNLTYGLNIYEDNSYTPISGTEVTIPANTSKEYYITVFSTNPVSSKFTLAYNNSNVTVEVSSRSGWNPSGLINEYSSNAFSKTIKVKVTNNTSSSQTVDFKAYGGYSFNSVASINLGNGYYSVIDTYNEAFTLEGELLTDIVKDDTNCVPTADSPCLYGGDTEVNYFKFDEEDTNVYRVIGNYLVNGEVLTKIIGPAITNDNINSSTTLSSADYQKIGGSSSYLGSNYASLSVYYLNSSLNVLGKGIENDEYIPAGDITITYTYLNNKTETPYSTFASGLNRYYKADVTCGETYGSVDSSGMVTLRVGSLPDSCNVNYSIMDGIALTDLSGVENLTVNHTYGGANTSTSIDTYINNLNTLYRAKSISCSSGTSATINETTGAVTFTSTSLPITCIVDFDVKLNKAIALNTVRTLEKVTINHTYGGASTSTSIDTYINNLNTLYRAKSISCSSGTSASINETTGAVTFTSTSLPATCTVDFDVKLNTAIALNTVRTLEKVTINHTYGGTSTSTSIDTFINNLNTLYRAKSINCSSGTSASINETTAAVTFTSTSLPATCTVDFDVVLNKALALNTVSSLEKVTLNYTYNGNTISSPDTYINGLGTTYIATGIECNSGTTASINGNGQITFTATSLPITCTVNFIDKIANTYTVTSPVDSSTYYFALNSNNYYESNNKGVNNSAALAKVNLVNNNSVATTLTITLINSGQSRYDYGYFSNIDTALSTSYSVDSTSKIYQSYKGQSSTSTKTLTYEIPSGTHYIYVKYIKNGSTNSGNDSLQFKIDF